MKDRLRVVLVTGALIAVAVVSSLLVIHLRSAPSQSASGEPPVAVQPPLIGGAPPAGGVLSAGVPPAEKAPALVEAAPAGKVPASGEPALPVTPRKVPSALPAAQSAPAQKAPPSVRPSPSVPRQEPAPRQSPAAPAISPRAPVSSPEPARETVPRQPAVPASRALPAATAAPPQTGGRTVPAASSPPAGIVERPVPVRGTLVFVIDDAGNNLADLEPFLKLNMPLTIAVLPGLPNSAEAARRIRAAGKEVFLHQPMEALGGQNPGPGAIRAGMGRDEIRAVISRNLAEVGPVAGMNNHEGSRITMNEEAMQVVLELCRERGILFLDSRTTAETAAPLAARRLGMTIGERDIFVDNDKDRESMLRFINSGLQKAEQKGNAIMIGHAGSRALAPLLADLRQDLLKQGYSFSRASRIINGTKL